MGFSAFTAIMNSVCRLDWIKHVRFHPVQQLKFHDLYRYLLDGLTTQIFLHGSRSLDEPSKALEIKTK